jgi:phosphoglycerol transferase
MAGSLALNLLPSFRFHQAHGPNAQGFTHDRDPVDAEVYGLKISHLLLPGVGHRLRHVHPYFDRAVSQWGVYLGLVGGAGFLLLVGRLVFRGPGTGRRSALLNFLCVLNGCGVLLATVSGFSSLFSRLVTPAVRCYYRMSVFLGFFALAAVAVGLDRLGRRLGPAPSRRALFYAVLAALLALGLVDQVPAPIIRDYDFYAQRFRDDAAFVAVMEASLPAGAMVFQLPYSPYPEPGPGYFGLPYEGLRPYLHSKTLRWSYGAYKGRPWDEWQKRVAGLPVDAMVRQLALAGFQGIYLDRNCCADGGLALEAGLARALGTPAVRSPDGKRSFFPLGAYAARLKEEIPTPAWEALHQAALDPVRAE